ncbi:hypothetical protein [Comamonas antarctica]|uniref:hypothetical protein n=1 Tax=Comamonas antarctica TaxID=2743470 RepID=UPI0028EEE722|nr:hypothetical protein [Comamonas antarctica]
MRIILETHRFAPELNKAYIGPTRTMVPVPGCQSIKDVRKKLFAPLKHAGRFVVLQSNNLPENKNYDRTQSGFCNDMRSLAGALNAFRMRHNLPGCTTAVKTKLIG